MRCGLLPGTRLRVLARVTRAGRGS
jgi:hypothetical protein